MRVLQICGYFPPFILGGDATAAYNYMKAMNLSRITNDAIIWPILIRKNLINIPQINKKFSNIIYRIRLSRFYSLFSRFFNYNSLAENELFKIIKKKGIKYDILQFHSPNTYGSHVFTRLKKELNCKIVVTLHDYWFLCPKQTLMNYQNQECLGEKSHFECLKCMLLSKMVPAAKICPDDIKKVDLFISPSQFLRDIYEKTNTQYKGKIIVIPNAFHAKIFNDLKQFVPKIKNKQFKVLFVGRLEWVKGITYLLSAFQGLSLDYKLDIVGTGRLEKKIEKQIEIDKILNQKVKLWGAISSNQLDELYCSCDVVCLPSIWRENNSMVLIEALSYGKPCITTNQGGNPEIIRDNINGFLVPIRSSSEIRKKIIKIAQDPNLYSSMQRECLKKFQDLFSVQSLSSHLEETYKKLMLN